MDILRVASEGYIKPTQIMYKANLSWLALLEHLNKLTKSGFLREEEHANRRVYELTSKGLEVLQSYQKVVSAVRDVSPEQVSF